MPTSTTANQIRMGTLNLAGPNGLRCHQTGRPHHYVRLVALTLASVSMACLGLLSFYLWWSVMEGMRVGNPNGHMSTFRAAAHNYWTHQYVGALFVGGMLLFWVVAAVWYRAGSNDEGISADLLPEAILFR
jgi:hypothetical protein